METRDHSRADVDGNRQNWSTDGFTKLFVDNYDIDDGMIDLPKGIGFGDSELTRAWRGCGLDLAFPAFSSRCHWDKFRHPPLDGAAVRRGEAFGEADFPNTPQECSKAWSLLFKPEAIHLLGNDALGSGVEPDRAYRCATFPRLQT